MTGVQGFESHLKTGITQIARCWKLTRSDGVIYGFTDHDRALSFDGVTFRPETGMTAAALSQTSGLSVDNTEALGVLRDAAITEQDIAAGRFDNAEVESWVVQWSAPENRVLQFRGTIGDITRANGTFTAELRGLADALNTLTGYVYQKTCTAMLGDQRCKFDLTTSGFSTEVVISSVQDGRVFTFDNFGIFETRWFERGQFQVLDGPAIGLRGSIKVDRPENGTRLIELWDRLRQAPQTGHRVRLYAGCDKRMETCRVKFFNILNFRGFPDIPGGDWQVAHPTRLSNRDGGSRR
jgi:uncharacterized phage protein (TIGR02218 family)